MTPPNGRAPARILLTGAGSIGRRHVQNLRSLTPGTELIAVCRGEESARWAAGVGVVAVPSVEAGLRMNPEIAAVCSVSSRHADDLDLLMPAVEGLYIEKPVVTGTVGLRAVRALLDAGWCKPTVVGCNLRYLPAVGMLKDLCDRGEAGRVALASLRVGQWLPDWRPGRDYRQSYSAHRDQGGGVIFDLVHELDSACFLFGDIVHGQAAAGSRSSLALESDEAASITLLMKSGLPVQIALDYVSRKPVREYTVVGDAATLRLDFMARELTRIGPDSSQVIATGPTDWDVAETYRSAMTDLLDAWRTGSATRYGLAEALHSTSWMVELESSAWRMAGAVAERQ